MTRRHSSHPLTGRQFVGVIAPYDFAQDREIWRWTPKNVTLLLTRTPRLGLGSTIEMAEAISDDATVRRAAAEVLTPDPAVVLYLCASGSFVRGPAGERNLREQITHVGARAAVTTAGALLEALSALGVRRLSLASPYIPAVQASLATFLNSAGHEVVASAGLGLTERIWEVDDETVRRLICSVDRPQSDAVFVSCTNMCTYGAIRQLEADLDKPVLTANQVSMWAALRAAGIRRPDIKQRLFTDTWAGD